MCNQKRLKKCNSYIPLIPRHCNKVHFFQCRLWPLPLQRNSGQPVKYTDTEIWRETTKLPLSTPKNKWRGPKCWVIYIYTHTPPHSAVAVHNRHFLGHNEGPSLQKGLAWLLIMTSGRKVSVLGLVTKSILKNMHLATAGRVRTRCLFRAGRRQMRPLQNKCIIIQSEETAVGLERSD